MKTESELLKAIEDSIVDMNVTIEKFQNLIAKKDFDRALDVANEIQNRVVGLLVIQDIID